MINDGGPAYPVSGYNGVWKQTLAPGMTLRDWFAGQALSLTGEFFYMYGNSCKMPDEIALAAYQIADAMIKARVKE